MECFRKSRNLRHNTQNWIQMSSIRYPHTNDFKPSKMKEGSFNRSNHQFGRCDFNTKIWDWRSMLTSSLFVCCFVVSDGPPWWWWWRRQGGRANAVCVRWPRCVRCVCVRQWRQHAPSPSALSRVFAVHPSRWRLCTRITLLSERARHPLGSPTHLTTQSSLPSLPSSSSSSFDLFLSFVLFSSFHFVVLWVFCSVCFSFSSSRSKPIHGITRMRERERERERKREREHEWESEEIATQSRRSVLFDLYSVIILMMYSSHRVLSRHNKTKEQKSNLRQRDKRTSQMTTGNGRGEKEKEKEEEKEEEEEEEEEEWSITTAMLTSSMDTRWQPRGGSFCRHMGRALSRLPRHAGCLPPLPSPPPPAISPSSHISPSSRRKSRPIPMSCDAAAASVCANEFVSVVFVGVCVGAVWCDSGHAFSSLWDAAVSPCGCSHFFFFCVQDSLALSTHEQVQISSLLQRELFTLGMRNTSCDLLPRLGNDPMDEEE